MKRLIIASLLFLTSSLTFASADNVGQVILSFGKNVAVAADGTERVLKRKSEVYAEDTLVTGGKGRLQIRFTDGSRLSLKPDTEFKIEQYQFDQTNPEEGKAFYKLIKGGMRTISGKIGKTNREDYKVDAVVATIGIRGTDYSIARQGDKISGSVNSGKINVAAKAGDNKDISAGRSFSLTGAQGTIVEFKTPPEQQSEDSASDSEENSEEQEESQGSEESEEGSESEEQSSEEQTSDSESNSGEESGEAATSSESADSQDTGSTDSTGSQTSTDTSSTLDSSVTVVTSTDSSAGTIPATNPSAEGTQDAVLSSPDPTGNGIAAPVGASVVLSYIEQDDIGDFKTSTGSVKVDAVSALTIDKTTGKDLLTGIQYVNTDTSGGDEVCTPCTFEAPSLATRALGAGTTTIGGAQVSWGRWGSGFEIVDNDGVVNVKGSFHFIYADQLTSSAQLAEVAAAKSGQYIYGFSDATLATGMEIETGNLGSLTLYNNDATQPDGTYMIINWDNQSIDTFNLKGQAEDPVYGTTRYYSLIKKDTNSVSLNSVLNGGSLDIQGTCSGSGSNCETIVDMSGRVSLEFVGNNAEGAISSYAAQGAPAASGEKLSITGAAILQDKGAVQ